MAVPPGVSEADFRQALARFARVVGDEWVFTSDEDIALYSDAYTPLWNEDEEKKASAALAPDSAEQVQEIVRIATSTASPSTRSRRAAISATAGPRPCSRAASCWI